MTSLNPESPKAAVPAAARITDPNIQELDRTVDQITEKPLEAKVQLAAKTRFIRTTEITDDQKPQFMAVAAKISQKLADPSVDPASKAQLRAIERQLFAKGIKSLRTDGAHCLVVNASLGRIEQTGKVPSMSYADALKHENDSAVKRQKGAVKDNPGIVQKNQAFGITDDVGEGNPPLKDAPTTDSGRRAANAEIREYNRKHVDPYNKKVAAYNDKVKAEYKARGDRAPKDKLATEKKNLKQFVLSSKAFVEASKGESTAAVKGAENRATCLRVFEENNGVLAPHGGSDTHLGVITNDAPDADGNFTEIQFDLGVDLRELEQQALAVCGGKVPQGVVGIMLRRGDGAEPNHKVLLCKHSEGKEEWGYDQEFWSFAGGKTENGQIVSSALGELYEESGWQLPQEMRLARIVYDPDPRVDTAFVIFEDVTLGGPGVNELSEPAAPAPQFGSFRYEQNETGDDGEHGVKYCLPRGRGDNDASKVIWASLDFTAEKGAPFIKSDAIDEDLATARSVIERGEDLSAIKRATKLLDEGRGGGGALGRFKGFANEQRREHVQKALES